MTKNIKGGAALVTAVDGANATSSVKVINPVQEAATKAGINMPSMFEFMAMISPFLVVLLFVLNSIINSNLKGMIYLLGVIFLFFMIFMCQSVLQITPPGNQKAYCKLFSMNDHINGVPSFNSSIFTFTLSYMFLPMTLNGLMNFPLLIILILLYVVDVVMKTKNDCTTYIGVALGSIVGIIWGVTWYFVIQTQNKGLLYYDDLISNKVACSRPSQQQFKCSVYKNGELLSTL